VPSPLSSPRSAGTGSRRRPGRIAALLAFALAASTAVGLALAPAAVGLALAPAAVGLALSPAAAAPAEVTPLPVAPATGRGLVLQPGRAALHPWHQVVRGRRDQAAQPAPAPDAARPVALQQHREPRRTIRVRLPRHRTILPRPAAVIHHSKVLGEFLATTTGKALEWAARERRGSWLSREHRSSLEVPCDD
jgi:hypothetical protein